MNDNDHGSEITIGSYPKEHLLGDVLRALLGLGFGMVLLIFAKTGAVLTGIAWALVLIFGAFAVRTWAMSRMTVTLDHDGLTLKGLKKHRLDWTELKSIRLRYYATRRQRKQGTGGFLSLVLKGPQGKITMESHMTGFVTIARRAIDAAGKNGLELDPTTLSNLPEIGIGSKEHLPH